MAESFESGDLRRGRRPLLQVAAATVAVALALGAAACGSDDSESEGNGSNGEAAQSSELPTSGVVKYFGPSRDNPYFGENEVGATAAAEELGWTLEYVEGLTQEDQDAAIQQMLSQGEDPVGVVMYPVAGEAAIGSEQAIMEAGIPLAILGQVPKKGQEELFDVYAGVNDVGSGATAAQLLADAAEKEGIELGDGLIVNTVAGHTASEDRSKGFADALKEVSPNSKVLEDTPSGGFLEPEGYDIGSQIIPANAGKINWVYGVNDALALGAARAARENGLTPGKDVLFVGGTCMNAATNEAVLNGVLVGTAVQSPFIEGQSAITALAQFLTTGEVIDGEVEMPADAPPPLDEPPHKWNFMPNPPVENTKESFETTEVWGTPASELCDYS